MKREVRVQDAVGMVLAHDLTRIVPGEFKGRLFAKGHVIAESDIPALLSIGKEHIYVLDLADDEVHEDDAAIRMAQRLQHPSLTAGAPHEGKITLKAAWDGLLVIDVPLLAQVNAIGDLVVVTKPSNTVLSAGQTAAAFRAIPLTIDVSRLQAFDDLVRMTTPLVQVLPFLPMTAGIVTTGSEVFTGRIEDRAGPILRDKLAALGVTCLGQTITSDETAGIVQAIDSYIAQGADIVLVTGGMSVDPDDRSPGAIRSVADDVVTYGMPVLPGSMTMLAYNGKTAIFGLPGCVIYDPITAFDLLFPRIVAGLRPTRADIALLGHGGML